MAAVPNAGTKTRLQIQAQLIFDIKAITRRANVGAIPAGKAAAIDIFPNLALDGPFKHALQMRALHLHFIFKDRLFLLPELFEFLSLRRSRNRKKAGFFHDRLTRPGTHLGHEHIAEIGHEEVITL